MIAEIDAVSYNGKICHELILMENSEMPTSSELFEYLHETV